MKSSAMGPRRISNELRFSIGSMLAERTTRSAACVIAAAVRHAITLEPKAASHILTLFKRMPPKNLLALQL